MSDKPVDKILSEALKAVTDAKLPDDLRPIAFEKAVEIVAARAGAPLVGGAAPRLAVGADGGAGAGGSSGLDVNEIESKSIERVAAKLGVDAARLNELFHIDGDAPALSIASTKLDNSKAKATRQIALLITSARQAGGWDAEWTQQRLIRSVSNQYGKFDQGNFATTIGSMGDEFGFKGAGPGRQLRMKQKGWEAATAVARAILGLAEA